MKDLEEVKQTVGIQISHDIRESQEKYIQKVLQGVHINKVRNIGSPNGLYFKKSL